MTALNIMYDLSKNDGSLIALYFMRVKK
jgi:hypothetical protein